MDWDVAYKTGKFNLLWENDIPTPELVATVATQDISKGKVALDIGCGAGTEALFLGQCGYHVHAIDLSTEAIQIAKERAKAANVNVDWIVGDAFHLPIKSNTVDFINDRGCFHIIPTCNRSKYAGEVSRVLKSGGTFLLRGVSTPVDQTCGTVKGIMDILKDTELDMPPFEPITEEAIHVFFPPDQYFYSNVFPLTSIGNQKLPMNMVYLKKL
jgi:ubiquinone/menaquinone biosynthesis C-methylase UbiE